MRLRLRLAALSLAACCALGQEGKTWVVVGPARGSTAGGETAAAGGGPGPPRRVVDGAPDALRGMVATIAMVGVVAVILLTRSTWYGLLRPYTVGQMTCPRPRNLPCAGRGAEACCWCCCPPYHPPFRLRVVVLQALRLRGARGCYVEAACGTNPAKTTSVGYPQGCAIVWNEPLDLELTTADEEVLLHVVTEDTGERLGCALCCADFLPQMSGDLEGVLFLPARSMRRNLLDANRAFAGELEVALVATEPGRPFPEALQKLAA